MAGNRKHIFIILGWIFLTLFLVLIGAGVFLYFKAESYINKNLAKIIEEKSSGLYKLSFSNLELDISTFSVIVSDVSLQPDEEKLKGISKYNPQKIFYSFESPKININHINPLSLYSNKLFLCEKITIVEPVLELSGSEILKKDSTQTFNNIFVEMRPLFRKYVKKVVVNEIEFVNANYGLYVSIGDSTQISNAQQISIGIKNFRTDSSLIFSQNHFFDSDDILVRMNQFKHDMGDSLHILNIDSLEYSLKSSDIYAHGFHLNYSKINPERSLYNVFVPHLHMKSKNITRFNLNDSISIQFLKFDNPQIKFYQKENPKQLNIEDISNFELHSLIKNQFSKIEIDSFVISHSNLEFYRQPEFSKYQQNFSSFDIFLNGFILDSVSSKNKEKLFYADDIEMLVKGYHLQLEDDRHDFFADSMFISTYSNSLGLRNIKIAPSTANIKSSRTEANIECKNLEINDINLKILYHTRTLPTKTIEVLEPNVQLIYHSEINRTEHQNETGLLFELVTAYSKGVYSENVAVKNGTLNIQNLQNGIIQGYFETNFNFNLANFSLDSASISETDKFFYAKDFDLQFSDYQMKLVDNLHKINADKISIHSSDKKVQIEKVHLQPVIKSVTDSIMQQFNRSELYDVYIPKITLWGINLRNAFFHNKINISKFQITQPKIYFENFGALRQIQKKKEFSEFYQLIFTYLNDFNIKEINAPEGTFSWVNHTKKGRTTLFDNEFSANLYNFRLNQNELGKQRLLFSDNFDITVKDQMFQLSDSVHILRAGEINLSTANKSISIKNALLYPVITSEKYKQLSTSFQVTIPALQISNFDFLKAYYSKILLLNKLELNSPKFEIYSKTGVTKSLDLNKYKFPLPAFIQSLELAELKINRGEVITYETKGIDQFAKSNFKIDLSLPSVSLKNNDKNQAQISSKNLIVNLSDFRTPIGKKHDLEIEKINFNRTQKSILIENLKVNPFVRKNSGNVYFISSPKMSFSNFDINEALNNNYFRFDKIKIENPKIEINISDSIKGNKLEFAKNLDLFPYVESYVDEIHANSLLLENVDLNLNWFDKELINKKFNLNFKEIKIGENFKPENILNSKEFELSTSNLKSVSKNKLYEFSAGKLVYNSSKHNILLKELRIHPLILKEEFPRKTGYQTDFLEAGSEFLELKEVDENLWLQENILVAKLLVIGKTNLSIYRNKRYPFNTNQRPPWPQDLLKEIKLPFVFDSVILLPSFIKFSELLDVSDEPGSIHFSDFVFKTSKFSNMKSENSKSNFIEINASAKLLNKSKLSAKFNFDLLDKNYGHNVTGSLEPIQLNALNEMVEKTAPIKIESGELNKFEFDISFSETKAEGKLYFAYDNFEISVLEYNKKGIKRSKWASFWANSLVINKKNPKGNILEPVSIVYKRDEQRSIINYWWKSIFTGSKKVIGIDDE